MGLEVPNITRSLVPIRSLVSSPEFKESKAELPIAIGSTIDGKTKVFDLAKASCIFLIFMNAGGL